MARARSEDGGSVRPHRGFKEPEINQEKIDQQDSQVSQSDFEPPIRRIAEVAPDDVDPKRIERVIEAEISGDGVIIPENSTTLRDLADDGFDTGITDRADPSEVMNMAPSTPEQNQEITSGEIQSFGTWISATAIVLLFLNSAAMYLEIIGIVVGTISGLMLGFIAVFAFFIQHFISIDD